MKIIHPKPPARKPPPIRPAAKPAAPPPQPAPILPATAAHIGEDDDGRRLDNYLIAALRPLPRAGVYRLIRTGQVRINGKRAAPSAKIKTGDIVRLPPRRQPTIVRKAKPPPWAVAPPGTAASPQAIAPPPIAFEDDHLLVIDKPAGLAAHGGSGLSFGAIELLRATRADRFLELIHRLDRETSGLLMLAKKPAALRRIHAALRESRVEKEYLAVVCGKWHKSAALLRAPLVKTVIAGGERRMRIAAENDQPAKPALTRAALLKQSDGYALLRVRPATGRTHQIRAHLAFAGLPIAGDSKYGDFTQNRALAKTGVKRMLLHAARLRLTHPQTGEMLDLQSPPPPAFAAFGG